MNQMEIFKNPEFGSVRVIEENGKYLFSPSSIITLHPIKALERSNNPMISPV